MGIVSRSENSHVPKVSHNITGQKLRTLGNPSSLIVSGCCIRRVHAKPADEAFCDPGSFDSQNEP